MKQIGRDGYSRPAFPFSNCDRQNSTPPKMSTSYSLEPVTTLPSMAKDGVNVIKVKVLRWGDFGFSGWAQCNYKSFFFFNKKSFFLIMKV